VNKNYTMLNPTKPSEKSPSTTESPL